MALQRELSDRRAIVDALEGLANDALASVHPDPRGPGLGRC